MVSIFHQFNHDDTRGKGIRIHPLWNMNYPNPNPELNVPVHFVHVEIYHNGPGGGAGGSQDQQTH